MTTNSTDISKFCPKAAYTPSSSPPPRRVLPNIITLKSEDKEITKAEYTFNEGILRTHSHGI